MFIIGNTFSENKDYVTINGLLAKAYPAHVELSWKNTQAFTYEIYRSVDGGKKFYKLTTCSENYYLDFFGMPLSKEQLFI